MNSFTLDTGKVMVKILLAATFGQPESAVQQISVETILIVLILLHLGAQTLHLLSTRALAALEVDDGQNARRVGRHVQAVAVALLEGGRATTAVTGMEGDPLAVLATAPDSAIDRATRDMSKKKKS